MKSNMAEGSALQKKDNSVAVSNVRTLPAAGASAGADTRPVMAAGSMLIAMVLIGFVDNYVATIATEVSVWQFLAVRSVMALALVAGLSRAGLGTLKPRRWWAVALRSLLVAIGLMCYFGSLAFMPIAQSLAGLFTSPIFVLLMTVLVLRQKIGPWRVVAVVVGFSGILVVLGVQEGLPGTIMLLPVAGGFFYAMGSLATRLLCAEESTISMLAGIMGLQGVVGACVLIVLAAIAPTVPDGAAGFLLRGWVWPIPSIFPLIVLQAFVSVVGVFFLIRAYQWGEASQVSVLEYTIMIFGPFFGWLLMGQVVTPSMIAGIFLIMIAGIIIAVRSK
ncbi:DMT family transporter [Pseudosulfitobacter sp. DSM 107133]|uniref:DMT family transporter n=1 Tax=Pseudosulfitobacter sp. DSM 107133 TaxID=2883100 RepID=UPI001F07135C|nr:DMT family transporter [Pseudosulfitobacter sp. DSM 107133]